MCGLGHTEMIVILVLVLLVFGPSKLPALAKSLGQSLKEFRKAGKELKDQASSDEDMSAALREVEAARKGETTGSSKDEGQKGARPKGDADSERK